MTLICLRRRGVEGPKLLVLIRQRINKKVNLIVDIKFDIIFLKLVKNKPFVVFLTMSSEEQASIFN